MLREDPNLEMNRIDGALLSESNTHIAKTHFHHSQLGGSVYSGFCIDKLDKEPS